MSRRLPVVVLALWTLVVWGGRLRNLSEEPGGLLEVGRWSLAGSVVLTALAVGVLALIALVPARGVSLAVILASVTIGVWLVRGADIALGDHSAGFIAVHLVLAAVSTGLSMWALWAVRRLPSRWWVSQ